MRKNAQLIEYLLRAVHDTSFIPLKMWTIIVKHYGAPKNERKIKGEKVLRVDRRGFYYKSIDGETFIPYYRILRLELEK